VDHLLFVSLVEFSTKEPASAYLYRGKAIVEAKLYKTSLPESSACVWKVGDLRVAYPEQEVVGQLSEDERAIRLATERLIATVISQSFYKHKASK
jgi:hypothetical protein